MTEDPPPDYSEQPVPGHRSRSDCPASGATAAGESISHEGNDFVDNPDFAPSNRRRRANPALQSSAAGRSAFSRTNWERSYDHFEDHFSEYDAPDTPEHGKRRPAPGSWGSFHSSNHPGSYVGHQAPRHPRSHSLYAHVLEYPRETRPNYEDLNLLDMETAGRIAVFTGIPPGLFPIYVDRDGFIWCRRYKVPPHIEFFLNQYNRHCVEPSLGMNEDILIY